MKIYLSARWFSLVVALMAFLAFSAPFLVLAQQAEMAEARVDAERDAKTDVNGTLWLGAGCLFNWVGVAAAYLTNPSSPPASRLIGKSPEYVSAYTDAYKAKGKSIQTSKAWLGLLVNVAAIVVISALSAAAAESNDTSDDIFVY